MAIHILPASSMYILLTETCDNPFSVDKCWNDIFCADAFFGMHMHSVIVNKSKRKFLIGEVLKSITIAKLVFLLMLTKKRVDFFW